MFTNLSTIPNHSCIRYPAIKKLSENLKVKDAGNILGVDPSIISRSKKSEEKILKHNFRVSKENRINPKIDSIVDFWLENCPVPSGSPRTVIDFKNEKQRVLVYVQRVCSTELYKRYYNNHYQPVCITTFLKYKPFNVKMARLPTKCDFMDNCPHCIVLKELIQKEKNTPLSQEEQKLKVIKQDHLSSSIFQINSYLKLREEVEKDSNSILIIQDFTKFYVNNSRYNDLMLSIRYYNEDKKQKEWMYLDFVEKGGGSLQDYYFVRTVWRYLMNKIDIPLIYNTNSKSIEIREFLKNKKKHIFNDGAPQHFKQKKTVSFWLLFK